jgi:putative FmdB family regulatory protein
MPPIYEFECQKSDCGKRTESMMKPWEREAGIQCPECGGKAEAVVTSPGGYNINGDNSASQRPKGAGSWKKK